MPSISLPALRPQFALSSPVANSKQRLAKPDLASSSTDTGRSPGPQWVGEVEFTLTINGPNPRVTLERSQFDEWDGDAEFTLRINGKGFTTERL